MFEPENQIERDLMRACVEESARPAFARALLDAQVWIVLRSDRPLPPPGPDGSGAIEPGTKLSLVVGRIGEQDVMPLFTAKSRARLFMQDQPHIVAPDTPRNLFARYPELAFEINSGSDYRIYYDPAQVAALMREYVAKPDPGASGAGGAS